jgi:serine/threonine-protein kinase
VNSQKTTRGRQAHDAWQDSEPLLGGLLDSREDEIKMLELDPQAGKYLTADDLRELDQGSDQLELRIRQSIREAEPTEASAGSDASLPDELLPDESQPTSAAGFAAGESRQDTLAMLKPTYSTVMTRRVKADIGELSAAYQAIRSAGWLGDQYQLDRLLGIGGQGEVYMTHRTGADGFAFRAALKLFSPEPFASRESYECASRRMAMVAALVAQENPDHVVGVHRFVEFSGIRVMQMELVDGPDLWWLLNRSRVELLESRVKEYLWRQTLNVVLRLDPSRPMPRLQPGVAVTVIRHCLRGLAALHKQGLVHGDIKLSNIMIRTTGTAKIIDFGSTFHQDYPPQERAITWPYAAPETIERFECTARSDLASLGYVLIELLSGVRLFSGLTSVTELWQAKVTLQDRLTSILPSPINEADGLVNFCRKLVAANPADRFSSAEAADLDTQCGASHFLRDLVCGNLDCVYEKPLGQWVEAMKVAFQYLATEERLDDRSLMTNSAWQRN